MRTLTIVPCLILLALALAGCSSKKVEDEAPKISAPINNNAPEAANAPAAPYDSSIPYPGLAKKR